MTRIIGAKVRQSGSSQSQGKVRTHTVDIDRPVSKGGTDHGPMGGELLLLGLGGCFMSNLLAAISARDARVFDVQVDVEATLEGSPERMTAFTMRVRGRGEDAGLLEKLVTIAERACIVTNTLKGAASISVEVDASTP